MISIIIPTYNEEGYLDATLRYLTENLSVKEYEIIVSDSRSTDATAAIAKRYAKRVKLVQMPAKKKRGISQGRNDGAAVAKGEILIFTDADVIIPKPNQFFENVRAKFNHDPQLLAFAPRLAVDPPRAHVSDRIIYAALNSFFMVMNLCGSGMAAGECMIIRTKAFRAVGGFNEALPASEDMDLYARLAKKGKTRIATDLIAYHSGRRFRKSGAWRTCGRWMLNTIWLWIFKKPADKEWETVR